MTNQEVARHFAALPPNEPATILLLNADVGTADVKFLIKFEDDQVGDLDDRKEAANAKGKVGVYLKY